MNNFFLHCHYCHYCHFCYYYHHYPPLVLQLLLPLRSFRLSLSSFCSLSVLCFSSFFLLFPFLFLRKGLLFSLSFCLSSSSLPPLFLGLFLTLNYSLTFSQLLFGWNSEWLSVVFLWPTDEDLQQQYGRNLSPLISPGPHWPFLSRVYCLSWWRYWNRWNVVLGRLHSGPGWGRGEALLFPKHSEAAQHQGWF